MNRWRDDELAYLESRAGYFPVAKIIESFKVWLRRHGYPQRPRGSIRRKFNMLGLSGVAELDRLSVHGVGKLMGCAWFTVYRWIEKGLPHTVLEKKSLHRYEIRLSDLREFILNNPQYFGGYDPEKLLWVCGEDSDILERIPKRSPIAKRPVIRCSDGQWYPSMRAAAIENHTVPQNIRAAIRRNEKRLGSHWEYA